MSTARAARGAVERSPRKARDVDLFELASRLTERDRTICRLLFEHRVLTTAQVAEVAFPALRKAQERLAVLHDLAVVERFRSRSWAGSGPYHFTLGPAGAAVVAAERGVEVPELGWRHDTAAALARSQRLSHLVGVNGFFTALVAASRRRPGSALAEWWSEQRCAAAWGRLVRPDGYGVYVEDEVRLPFLLEHDQGTERLARLEGKLAGYARLARAAKHPTWVLFSFPSAGREVAARRVLAHPEVAVATAVIGRTARPDGAVWQAVGEGGPRRRLIELGHPSRVLEARPA